MRTSQKSPQRGRIWSVRSLSMPRIPSQSETRLSVIRFRRSPHFWCFRTVRPMRLKKLALASIAILLLPLLLAAKCGEATPDVFPGCESPGDKVVIMQLWTYEPEPLRIRLSIVNGEGVPIVGNKGQNLGNYETEVNTRIEREGGAAVWELELCYPGTLTGSVKIDLAKGVKVGCKFFRRDETGRRTSLPYDQDGQGPRSTCIWSVS